MAVGRVVRHIFTVAVVIVVLLLGGAWIVIHTAAFNRFVKSNLVRMAAERTGARLVIGRMEIHWTHLSTDLYDVSLNSEQNGFNGAFASTNHLGVKIRFAPLFHRRIEFNEISLDQPVVQLLIDAEGRTNLPRPPPQQSTSSFTVGIDDLKINSGQFDYNDQRIPISGSFRDVKAQATYNGPGQQYVGWLTYDRGRVVTKQLNSIEHSAQAHFIVGTNTAALDSMLVFGGKSHVSFRVNLADYNHPDAIKVTCSYQAVFDSGQLTGILRTAETSRGNITLSGSGQYRPAPGRTALDSIVASGKIESPSLALSNARLTVRANSLSAAFSLDSGTFRFSHAQADLLGGHLTADYEIRHVSTNPASHLNASMNGLSLRTASEMLSSMANQHVAMIGTANIEAQLSWAESIRNIQGHSRVAISAPPQSAAPGSIPLNGLVDVTYDGRRNIASFGNSYMRTGNTTVSVSGMLGAHSNLRLQAETTDLHEIGILVSSLKNPHAAGPSRTPDAADIHGVANFAGQVTGSLRSPNLQGQLTARNVDVSHLHFPSLLAQVQLAPSVVSVQNGRLDAGGEGRLNFSARSALQQWSFTPASAISVQLNASRISVADWQQLAGAHYPVSGSLSGEVSLSGSESNLRGNGSLQVSHGSVWGETISSLSADFETDGQTIRSKADLKIPAGNVNANLAYSMEHREYQGSLSTNGLKIEQVALLRTKAPQVSGVLSVSATGKGTLENPQASADLKVPSLQIGDQTLSQVTAHADFTNQRGTFVLDSHISQGGVQARADVTLTGEYPATATLDVRDMPLQVVLASYVKNQSGAQGQFDLHASLSGPLKDPSRIDAHLQVPKLNVAYQLMQLANNGPLEADYKKGILVVRRSELKGTGTDLVVQGNVPIEGPGSLDASAKGTVDLAVLQMADSSVRSSGRLDLNLSARGSFAHPDIGGSVGIEGAAISAPALPVSLESFNGKLSISNSRLSIDSLAGKAGGGDVFVRGAVLYGKETAVNLALVAKSVRLRPNGLRAVLNANLQWNGTPRSSVLSGQIIVDKLSFIQGFDVSTLATQFSGPSSPPSSSSFESGVKLNVAVQSASNLTLASSKASVGGSADFRVTGTLSDPVILGRVTLTSGEVFFLGKRYEVAGGSIAFNNPVRTQPNLNVNVTTQIEQYNITLRLEGPIDRLRTNYTSVPPLSSLDIINLIAFGHTTAEQQSASSGTPTALGAESVVANGVAGQAAGKVANAIGISQLTIDPLANSNQNPGAQIAVQQRVTANLLLTFSTDVTSTQASAVQLQYQLNPRWRVSVLRDTNGGYGIDLRLHKNF